MAKLIKIVIQVFLMAIIFIPNYSTAQVNYTAKKDRHAEWKHLETSFWNYGMNGLVHTR